MFRSMLCSLVILGVYVGFVAADAAKTDVKDKTDKKGKEAKITKVDAKKGTVTVKMEVKGKELEKTFKLAEDIKYMDSSGKVATVELFNSGDMVLIVEADGKITQMKKKDKPVATTKDEFIRTMHKWLDEFNGKCKQLEARIPKAEGEAKKDLKKTLAQAKVKCEAAAKKLKELEEAGADRWEKVREGVGMPSTT